MSSGWPVTIRRAEGPSSEHISPGLLRILDRLEDTPAEIVTELGETLRQTRMGIALTGDASQRRGPARCCRVPLVHRPGRAGALSARGTGCICRGSMSPGLRSLVTLRGNDSRAAQLAELLLPRSAEFRELWTAHEVGVRPPEVKRFDHPEVGPLELHCQTLLDPDQSHRLLVYTAVPGSESYAEAPAAGGHRRARPCPDRPCLIDPA